MIEWAEGYSDQNRFEDVTPPLREEFYLTGVKTPSGKWGCELNYFGLGALDAVSAQKGRLCEKFEASSREDARKQAQNYISGFDGSPIRAGS